MIHYSKDLNKLTFEPNASWNGATSFSWKGHDGTAYSTEAADVNMTLAAVNDAPTIDDIRKAGMPRYYNSI